MNAPLTRIALFGDHTGIPAMLSCLPRGVVVALVAASIRPQGHAPLAAIAKKLGVPLLLQPRIDDAGYASFRDMLARLAPDALLCYSYSMLIREDILALAPGRGFNLHTSLLPLNRGPNPVQWALIHGDAETGVTLHVMDAGFDTGPIVAQRRVAIADEDTWISLLTRLQGEAKLLLADTLPDMLQGKWNARPQDETKARHNSRIPKTSFPIRFAAMDDRTVFNLIRAQIAPLAGAYVPTAEGNRHMTEFMPCSAIPQLRARYA